MRIPLADGTTMGGYLAVPAEPRGAGVVVGMELFGVDAHVRDVCDRLARHGYTALAPDLYHREYHRELGPSGHGDCVVLGPDERDRGFALLGGLTRDGVLADVRAAVAELARRGAPCAGMVGLSVGGHVAYLAATELDLPAVACLYPGWLTGTDIPISRPTLAGTPGITGRVLLLAGTADHVVPAADRAAIRGALTAAGVPHEIVEYPGVGHGYLSDRRPGYDANAAADTWRRILALLAG